MSVYEITLAKENMKFSSAHFTVFEHGVERLHGHNYRVVLTLKSSRLRGGMLLDFAFLKLEARRLCAELDETLLLPAECRDLAIETRATEIEVRCFSKRYVLPAQDCRLLPIPNVTCECLAEYFCRTLLERLRPQLREAGVVALVATVEESPGQSGRCEEVLLPAVS
jgi:6-pyruvoyltetrahydropterin/6-carboxytetrahydropterin synthase